MRSIPAAMIWETLHRGRWTLIFGLLGANVMHIIVLMAFGPLGAVELDFAIHRALHSTLVQLNMFVFGTAVLAAQGVPSRLYTFPIPTAMLVGWHMFIAMFLVGFEMALSLAFLNAMSHLNWPIWGPALFAAVALGILQATFWYTEKTAWLAIAMPIAVAPLAYWYFRRFVPTVLSDNHPLIDIAPFEIIILSLVVVASYFVAVAGVTRNRYGEQIKPLGILAWLARMLDFQPVFSPPFRSRMEAQYWFDWTLKGLGMPVIVVAGILVTIVIWLIASRNPKELVDGFTGGGAMLSAVGLVIGLIMGNMGPADGNLQMGHFLSTRPLTSSSMAHSVLKVAVKSVFVSWAIWAGSFAILAGILKLTGCEPHPFFPPGEHWWWYFPATLLGCWTVTAVIASMVLTGRAKELIQLACGLLTCYIGLVICANFALSWDARQQLFRGLTIALGIVLVLSSVVVFVTARRRQLIPVHTMIIAGGVWLAISSVVAFEWSTHRNEPSSNYVLIVGLAALTVVPFAAAPLALAWNRNR